MVRLCIQGRTFQGKKNNKIGCVLSETQGSNRTLCNNSNKNQIFKVTTRLQQDSVRIVREQCVCNNEGKLTIIKNEKLKSLVITL